MYLNGIKTEHAKRYKMTKDRRKGEGMKKQRKKEKTKGTGESGKSEKGERECLSVCLCLSVCTYVCVCVFVREREGSTIIAMIACKN